MRWRTFLFWNALGGMAWALSVGLVAYLLGHTAERLFKVGGIAAVALAALAGVAYLLWRARRARSAAGSG
jgi:membrane protein DedA with SNARE-associated domain